jgi:hypothetical protein
VVRGKGQQTHAIECKINPDHIDPTNLMIFRSLYPEGKNYVLIPNIKYYYQRRYEELMIDFVSVNHLFTIKEKDWR